MMIAIDARKLRDGGIGTYIRNLIGAIAAIPGAPGIAALLDPSDLGTVAWPPDAVLEQPVSAGKYSLAEHWKVPRAARDAGAALLHAPHYTLPLGWKGPSVVTIFDLIHLRFASHYPPGAALYARAMAGAAARRADRVIVSSNCTRDDLVELLGTPARKIRVIPLGVARSIARRDPDAVAAFRRERSLPADYLLYVGARKRHKNLELLVRALATLRPQTRPPLVLSGAPGLGPRLERLARATGVEKSLHFAATADDAELSLLYSGAALYLQPSLYEGFGLPPLEAMACGVPVVSSTGGSLPEAVGDAAVLLDPGSPSTWAGTILALLGDGARRATLAQRGLERAGRFTWEGTAQSTLAVYEEALAG